MAVAVVQAGSYSSYSTPSLGTSVRRGCGPEKKLRPKKKKIKTCNTGRNVDTVPSHSKWLLWTECLWPPDPTTPSKFVGLQGLSKEIELQASGQDKNYQTFMSPPVSL